jgi:hypothetical protein
VWFDDYEDRVLFDEAGLFDYTRVTESGKAPKNLPSPMPGITGCQ